MTKKQRYQHMTTGKRQNTVNMKTYSILLLMISGAFADGRAKTAGILNVNTWSISVGKTQLLSWMKQEIGAEASVKKSALRLSDTLHAQMYFCGSDAGNSTSVLTIKNSSDSLIAAFPHKNTGPGFEADAPLKGFLSQCSPGETLQLYFSIFNAEQKAMNRTLLLGKLKLR